MNSQHCECTGMCESSMILGSHGYELTQTWEKTNPIHYRQKLDDCTSIGYLISTLFACIASIEFYIKIKLTATTMPHEPQHGRNWISTRLSHITKMKLGSKI